MYSGAGRRDQPVAHSNVDCGIASGCIERGSGRAHAGIGVFAGGFYYVANAHRDYPSAYRPLCLTLAESFRLQVSLWMS